MFGNDAADVVVGLEQDGCDQGNRAGGDGQACLWWSQGCSIGCAKCATNSEGPHSRGPFHGTGPQSGKIGFRTRYCNATHNSAKSSTNPTPLIDATLPKEAWTLNIGAEEGSEEDSYRFNPWRCVHSPSASNLHRKRVSASNADVCGCCTQRAWLRAGR